MPYTKTQTLGSKVLTEVRKTEAKNDLTEADGPGEAPIENEYGIKVGTKHRISQSMVNGAPRQRRRRGDRSGDTKSSFIAPIAISKNVSAPMKQPNVVDQENSIAIELLEDETQAKTQSAINDVKINSFGKKMIVNDFNDGSYEPLGSSRPLRPDSIDINSQNDVSSKITTGQSGS